MTLVTVNLHQRMINRVLKVLIYEKSWALFYVSPVDMI